MSALPTGARLLDGSHGLPPKEQRILAPSTVDVEDTGGYSRMCNCTIRVVDVVNLTVYYVPMTAAMVSVLRRDLAQFDSSMEPVKHSEDNHK